VFSRTKIGRLFLRLRGSSAESTARGVICQDPLGYFRVFYKGIAGYFYLIFDL
jgi:hypothetical protein